MRRFLIGTALMLGWVLIVVACFVAEEWLRRPPVQQANIASLHTYLASSFTEAAASKRFGRAAFILTQQGKIVAEHEFGISHPQTDSKTSMTSSLFLLCSVSKAVTAWGVIKLVEEGKIKLDEPVTHYLKRWQFPGNDPFANRVTVRHLLSHTGGIDDGFGTSGYLSQEEMPTLEEWLSNPSDANMGPAHATQVTREPGTALSYSTAGYGVLQLVVEEVTGKAFNSYMKETVLHPLGMSSSSYDLDELLSQGRLAEMVPNYDRVLKTYPLRRHANQAGASLRVTTHEMALFLSAYAHPNPVLKMETLTQLLLPQPGTSSSWSLGHQVYMSTPEGSFIVGHGGGAFPRTGASMRFNSATGNGIAILMSGGNERIDPYMEDWMYWETGKKPFDIRSVVYKRLTHGLVLSVLGIIIIAFWLCKPLFSTSHRRPPH